MWLPKWIFHVSCLCGILNAGIHEDMDGKGKWDFFFWSFFYVVIFTELLHEANTQNKANAIKIIKVPTALHTNKISHLKHLKIEQQYLTVDPTSKLWKYRRLVWAFLKKDHACSFGPWTSPSIRTVAQAFTNQRWEQDINGAPSAEAFYEYYQLWTVLLEFHLDIEEDQHFLGSWPLWPLFKQVSWSSLFSGINHLWTMEKDLEILGARKV